MMPTVDYKDDITGEIFEEFIRSGEIPEHLKNPNTGNQATRIFSGSLGFEFKGTGFYATDYKGKP